MTCIVGIEHAGRVYIGADSAGASGYSITARSDGKCWDVGNWAFGFTSSFRMGQLLRYRLDLPEQIGWDVDRYMATDFIDSVRTVLAYGGWKRQDSGQDRGGVFLVGYRDRLYRIDSDFQMGRSLDGYESVGCGSDIALGSLHSTVGDEPMRRIHMALSASAHHSAGVCPPFTTAITAA